mmetsp:Transcript_1266/g.2270  ORF Transcript_1266/g.2270 Transcript_1266/m.2270 type:complete len:207 (-) Transcript_1266:512-1132(-)
MKIPSILIAASWWIHSAVAFECESDTYPVGSYSTLFVPCQVVFYQSRSNAEEDWGYGCDSMDASAFWLETRPITILLFPDQCVGDENRCYTLENNIQGLNESLYENLLPPEGTTHVMVDCTEDKVAANQFVGDVTDMADDYVSGVKLIGYVFLFSVIGSIAACIYCCCGSPVPKREIQHVATPHSRYVSYQRGEDGCQGDAGGSGE